MKRGEALASMRLAAQTGTVVLTEHAQKQMESRGLTRQGLYHAMQKPTFAVEQRGGTFAVAGGYTWRCRGRDLSGEQIGWVAAIQGTVVVVTVYDPAREDGNRRGRARR